MPPRRELPGFGLGGHGIFRLQEQPVPKIHGGRDGAREAPPVVQAVRLGHQALMPEHMGQKHGRRVAVPHLHRLEHRAFGSPQEVEKQLGRFPDAGDGFGCVYTADEAEIRDGVQLEQIGTGHREKIPHHEIGRPGFLQLRQGIEHIKGLQPGLRDHPMHLRGERLEPGRRVQRDHHHAVRFGQDGGMSRKPEIIQLASVGHRLRREPSGHMHIFLEAVGMPHHIVAEPQIVNHLVVRRNAGAAAFPVHKVLSTGSNICTNPIQNGGIRPYRMPPCCQLTCPCCHPIPVHVARNA